MMLGLSGRGTDFNGSPLEVDVFAFHLAHELGRTVTEVEQMPYAEYVAWRAYFTARAALDNLRPVDQP